MMINPLDSLRVRTMVSSDITAADSLRAIAGWNQLPDDWRRLLQHEPDGCFVATADELVVGTVTTTRHQPEPGWIGMMLVHPDFRGQGIARRLMQAALDYLQQAQVRCIMLDATPAGEPLYRKMGFVPEWRFSRWHRAEHVGGNATDSAVALRSATVEDFLHPALHPLDCEAFGADRSRWLARLLPDSLRHCRILEDHDSGFGMLRSGSNALYLGPVTASSTNSAMRIVDDLLHSISGPVFWDVPEPNHAAVEMAEARGFQRLRTLTRMRLGDARITPQLNLQFAICDPATG